jgi:hypothetical protein
MMKSRAVVLARVKRILALHDFKTWTGFTVTPKSELELSQNFTSIGYVKVFILRGSFRWQPRGNTIKIIEIVPSKPFWVYFVLGTAHNVLLWSSLV